MALGAILLMIQVADAKCGRFLLTYNKVQR